MWRKVESVREAWDKEGGNKSWGVNAGQWMQATLIKEIVVVF